MANMKNFVFVFILLIGVIFLCGCIGPKDCGEDAECFTNALAKCEPAIFENASNPNLTATVFGEAKDKTCRFEFKDVKADDINIIYCKVNVGILKGIVENDKSTYLVTILPLYCDIVKITSGTYNNKFEWAEAHGCGSAYPIERDYSDEKVRGCIDLLYAETDYLNEDTMSFDEWLEIRPDLEDMNIYGQENRYADYLWDVKQKLS